MGSHAGAWEPGNKSCGRGFRSGTALASFLGSTPGCLGAFMNVSLYIHGTISFGAIVGGKEVNRQRQQILTEDLKSVILNFNKFQFVV